ncbi:MAG TPA: hypothetical protein VMF56_07000 [Acidobacteriaceae bacterium]|nr:hypothetical protein [Acidobacteriaceae bacterium]
MHRIQMCGVGRVRVGALHRCTASRTVLWGQGFEAALGMDACGIVVAAGDRGLQWWVGGEYDHAFCAHDLFGVGGVHAFFHCYGRHIAMQCDRRWDGQL